MLPLLSAIRADFDLSGYKLICCQHLLESQKELFFFLLEHGLLAENVFVIGKAYSTNKEIVEDLKAKGMHIDEGSFFFDSHRSYDEQFQEKVGEFLKKISQDDKKIIILDDGGYLVLEAKKHLKKFIAVEQTSSGFNKVKEEKESIIINVARSKAKLSIESDMIAKSFFSELKKRYESLPKIMILGAGPIGNAIKKKIPMASIWSEGDSLEERKRLLSNAELIVGATGVQSVSFEEVKGKILASVSSSDREFPSFKIRKLLPRYNNSHKDISVKGITLLNSGFPLNFTGEKISVPTESIQFTMGLLYKAIQQAISEERKGIIPLNDELQEEVISAFKNL